MRSRIYRVLLFIVYILIGIGDIVTELLLDISHLIIGIVKLGFSIIVFILRLTWLCVLFISFFLRKFLKSLLRGIIVFFKPINPFKIKMRIGYLAFITGFLTCLIIFSSFQFYQFYKALPSPSDIGKVNYPISSHLYDTNGKLLYEVYKDQSRTPVKIKDLPKYIVQATIAFEDKDFYHHNGIAPISGILRAVRDTLIKKNLQGGSTITQQLVKSSLLSPERTWERKIKEMVLAIQTERMYNKNQILEMYLNQVPYGGAAYGIEEAAQVYFNKHAKELLLNEAALLAGLPQSPSVYSPFVNPDLAIKRRNEVLERMYEQKYITEKQKSDAQKTKLHAASPKTHINAPHFVFYVKNELEKEFGTNQIETGGLSVSTTLDLNIQTEAETILKEELEKIQYLNVTNGAILVTRPKTGEILAMVGSVDYFASPSGAFNVTTALRQPGSSIKPIMYSLALEKNYTAASIIDDSPVVFVAQGAEPYRPVNYDGRFHGKVPLRYALANSYNVPAVRVLQSLGVPQFINHGKRMGITSWGDPSQYGLALTLGGGEVTMLDMATAMGVFANGGERVSLTPIKRLQDSQGRAVDYSKQPSIKVLNEGVAYIISDILSDNVARLPAFGAGSALEIPGYKVSVKTGTTDQKKDNWTIGYTPDFLVAVWVGNNDNTPMNPYLSSGITGAAPIWNRVMRFLLENYTKEKKWFTKPDVIVERACLGRLEYFIRGTENSVSCQIAPTATPTIKMEIQQVLRENAKPRNQNNKKRN